MSIDQAAHETTHATAASDALAPLAKHESFIAWCEAKKLAIVARNEREVAAGNLPSWTTAGDLANLDRCLADARQEIAKIEANCPEPTECEACNGIGDCWDCEGSGRSEDNHDDEGNCSACDGSGVCCECDGEGSFPATKPANRFRCPQCGMPTLVESGPCGACIVKGIQEATIAKSRPSPSVLYRSTI